jgi:uncharacterized protein
LDGRELGTPQTLPPIDAYGDGGFRISGTRYEGHQLVTEDGAVPWNLDANLLRLGDLEPLLKTTPRPDTVILGVGERLKHPSSDIRKAFRAAKIGLEVLDTATACRTYNLLAGEGRRVYAALIAI